MAKKKVSCVKIEYQRLKLVFETTDPKKAELVDELLKKAAFLKVELDKLEEIIKVEGINQVSSKGNKRTNPLYKTYLSSVNSYQTIIRTLNSIMSKSDNDSDDEFDDFIRQATGQ